MAGRFVTGCLNDDSVVSGTIPSLGANQRQFAHQHSHSLMKTKQKGTEHGMVLLHDSWRNKAQHLPRMSITRTTRRQCDQVPRSAVA